MVWFDKDGEFQTNKSKKKEREWFFTISYLNIGTKGGEIDVLTR